MRRYRDRERMERMRDHFAEIKARYREEKNRYREERERFRNRYREENDIRQTGGRRSLYRSRNGMILGICRGLADKYDVPVFWIRAGVVFLMITTTFWPVILVYFGIGFYLKPEPVIPFSTESEDEFYNSFTNSRSMAVHRLKKEFDQLQNRLHRMENVVTSKEFNWDMKMKEG